MYTCIYIHTYICAAAKLAFFFLVSKDHQRWPGGERRRLLSRDGYGSKVGTSKIGWSILQIDPNLWCPGPYMLICSCWFVSPTVLPCLPIQGRKSESIPRLIINCPISGYAVPWIDSTPLLLMVVHLGHIPHGIHACLCLKSQLDLLSHNIPYVCW